MASKRKMFRIGKQLIKDARKTGHSEIVVMSVEGIRVKMVAEKT